MGASFNFDEMLSSAREAYGEELYKMAKEGIPFMFTFSDNVAASTAAGKMIKEFPDRCISFGIAEPDQVGASAGMALAGNKVFAQVMGPFLPLRAGDQVHTDIAYNRTNVVLIGTHSGVTAGGGPTHNVICDLALYRAIPNLTVLVPADAGQCCRFIRMVMDYDGPVVIRIDRAGAPNIYSSNDYPLEIGKAIELAEGSDAYIISCGSNLHQCKLAVKEAEEKLGLDVGIIDMHTIKPFDKEMIAKVASKTKAIITFEDHSVNGGLGGAVAEALCECGWGGKFKKIGMPDEFAVLGSLEDIYHYYGMDAEGIVNTLKEWFNK